MKARSVKYNISYDVKQGRQWWAFKVSFDKTFNWMDLCQKRLEPLIFWLASVYQHETASNKPSPSPKRIIKQTDCY